MRPLKAARAAAPDGASDPRRVDQAGQLIGADATARSPSLQAGHRAGGRLLQVIVQEGGLKVVGSQFLELAEGLDQVEVVCSATEGLCEVLPSASVKEAIGAVACDVVDFQVGGRA
jgi:hypothetical protein